jgi:hypothetical protein
VLFARSMQRGRFPVANEDRDKEMKRLKSFDCNRKPLERLRFQHIKICINIHYVHKKKGLDLFGQL